MYTLAFIPILLAVAFTRWLPHINTGGITTPPFGALVSTRILRKPPVAQYAVAPIRLPHKINIVAGILGALVTIAGIHIGAGLLAPMAGTATWVAVIACYTDLTQERIPRTACWMTGVIEYTLAIILAVTGNPIPIIVTAVLLAVYIPWIMKTSSGTGDHRILVALTPLLAATITSPLFQLSYLLFGLVAAAFLALLVRVSIPPLRHTPPRSASDITITGSLILGEAIRLAIGFFRALRRGFRAAPIEDTPHYFPAAPTLVGFLLLPALILIGVNL